MQTALGKYISNVTYDYSNAGNDATVQLNQADTDLAKGDCILIVAAVDSTQAATIVAHAKAKNVPVIAYDRLIQSNDLAYYVSFDNEAVGKIQGKYIADHYSSYVSTGHNNLVMIDGAQTDNNALLFYKGAIGQLQPLIDAGTLKKVYDQYTPKWDNATAQTEFEGALTANSNDVSIAYVMNDGMANSVIAALKAKQLNGKVLVTGQDATVAGIQNILTGDQAMTVEKNEMLEATAAAEIAAALSNGASTASLTGNTTTATSTGAKIPSILETPVAIDKSNWQQVVTDGLVTLAQVCASLPASVASTAGCA
jgi:D-xylose transport system substrate-binding protein